MCGLAGIWHPGGKSLPQLSSYITPMASSLHHRGPDDSGSWIDPTSGIAIAHQRLSVLDLSSAGHQPMHSPSGRYVIVFNGEIYNHKILRQELQDKSLLTHQWRGNSDTETLLAAVEAWGLIPTLERCAGMFAIALWDRVKRSLSLVRDRFGEKPLYWGWVQHADIRVLVFASELAALRALPGVGRYRCDPPALQAFFQYGSIPAPLCIYQGLYQLAPGYHVELEAPNHLSTPQPWWNPHNQAQASAVDQPILRFPSTAIEALDSTLQLVIREQALADVSLGSFLSGGIDSSLITALLQAQSPRPVRSFTIAFPDNPGFNEAPFAAAVAAHLGTDHTEVPLTSDDALALIPQLPVIYSEPFADSSQLPTHLICREARRSGLTVALSGDGGDELFGGYNRHRLLPAVYKRIGAWPVFWHRALAQILEQLPTSSNGLARDKLQKLVAALRNASSLEHLQCSVTSVWRDPCNELLQPSWAVSACVPGLFLPAAPTPEEQLMLADALSYLPSDVLVKVDRAAMATSLETRAPFLDHRVADLAWQLPLSLKISRSGSSKWVLRQLLDRYVPRHLMERPKAGFAMPIGAWLCGPLRRWADELLDPALLHVQGYLRPEPIQHLWQEHQAGRYHTSKIWSVLMWQAWLAQWG